MKNIDLNDFFSCYLKGALHSAIQQIIPNPNFAYDQLYSSNELLPYVVNFIDASTFGTPFDARMQNAILRNFLERDLHKSEFYPKVIERLATEDQFLLSLITKSEQTLLNSLPEQLTKFHLMIHQGWEKCKKHKSAFIQEFASNLSEIQPSYPLQYSLPILSIQGNPLDKIPVIFVEPTGHEFAPFFEELRGRAIIFVFSTLSHFLQMLQFPFFAESLEESNHLIYILECYPHVQFASQEIATFQFKELYPVFFASSKYLELYSEVLLDSLKDCLAQGNLNNDTLEGNRLYKVAKRLLLSQQQHRLGLTRIPALQMNWGQKQWYDTHKGPLPSNKSLGPASEDLMKVILENLAQKRVVRAKKVNGKIRLAHVVPQLIYGGHAPTCLLENLVLNYDPEKFEVMVFSTEVTNKITFEYPAPLYTSPSSLQRGAKTIQKFQEKNVSVMLNQQGLYYIDNAFNLGKELKKYKVDVVVFHGPDIVNIMATQLVDVPLRVLFEHGTQTSYPGFDLAILSSESALNLYQDQYSIHQTKAVALPFSVNIQEKWLPEPFSREFLGLPNEGSIMTTISTKLDIRLTDEFCRVVATILQLVPNALYAPIGMINNLERIKKIFTQYGVEDRLYPIGEAAYPASQYVRSMQLYLNEFPEGGCLALLDAMATGCPVVSMYDEVGPEQARYGGMFMGKDYVVTSGKKEDYIALACLLLSDSLLYQAWSQHTLQRYEKFSDGKNYVKSFENIILENFN